MKQMQATHRHAEVHQRPMGFTLTEMLVAVGLLLVIMTIFAQIFQLAVGAMSSQKGLANNDSRARTAFSVLDADLKRMSYRSIKGQGGIVPLVPGLLYNGQGYTDEQRGYFYYSENNPADDTDDVLQFTVDATVIGQYSGARRYANQSQLPYYGRAASLNSDTSRRDQPDWDDGTFGNSVATSRWAEVAYFLRHGTLYRRVLLIRDTDDGVPGNMGRFDDGDTRNLAQPGFLNVVGMTTEAVDMMRPDAFNPSPYTGNFYTDFDFSAHRAISPYDADSSSPYGASLAVFHGSLSNEFLNNWPLGIPHFRFGFSRTSGLPREFVTDTTTNAFIGRYTHEETSHGGFGYPHQSSAAYTRTDFNIASLQATGRVNVYLGGSRRGTDILLTNVHGFNVEIWDPTANGAIGGFVDIDSTAARDTGSRNGTLQHAHEISSYGPTNNGLASGVMNVNVFDSWHHDFINAGITGLTQNPRPPMAPLHVHPNDATVPTYPGITVKNRWASGANLFDANGNPIMIFPSDSSAVYSNLVVWQAVIKNPIPAASTLGTEPVDWLPGGSKFGSVDCNAGIEVLDLQDYDGNSGNDPDVVWVPVDNRKPIKAIRVTVRFLDPSSGQMRQMSMIHSFNEDEIRSN